MKDGSKRVPAKQVPCEPCDVVAAMSVVLGVCNTFPELDCTKIRELVDSPDEHTVSEAVEALQALHDEATGPAKEQIRLLIDLAAREDREDATE